MLKHKMNCMQKAKNCHHHDYEIFTTRFWNWYWTWAKGYNVYPHIWWRILNLSSDIWHYKIGYRTLQQYFECKAMKLFFLFNHSLSRFSFSPRFSVFGICIPTCHYYDLANHLKLSCIIFIHFPSIFRNKHFLLVFCMDGFGCNDNFTFASSYFRACTITNIFIFENLLNNFLYWGVFFSITWT